MRNAVLLLVLASLPGACVPTFTLVKPEPTAVGNGDMAVTPGIAWNSVPMGNRAPPWEEVWTLNGPLLDSVVFVSGVPDGKAIVRQRRKADAQVPVFRADMSPDDLVSMIEGAYRVGGVTVFNLEAVDPVQFLGGSGLRIRYSYAPGDGMGKKGNCVLRVVDQKLFLIKLEGVAAHYYDAALPEFERLVASATLE